MYGFNDDKSKAPIIINTGEWHHLGRSVSSITTSGGTITWSNFEQILDAYHEIAVVFIVRLNNGGAALYESRGTIIFGSNMPSEGFSKRCMDGDTQYLT